MPLQFSVSHRTNKAGTLTADVGASAVFKFFTGAIPANCATADTGTLLATLTEAGSFGSSAAGVYTVTPPAASTGVANGIAGYFRVYPSVPSTTNAVIQGTCYMATTIVTSVATAANSNVLTFASVTGLAVGQTVSGTGILPNSTIIATTGTTVTMNQASTAGVGLGVTVTFAGDLTLANTSIAVGQAVSVTSMSNTAAGA